MSNKIKWLFPTIIIIVDFQRFISSNHIIPRFRYLGNEGLWYVGLGNHRVVGLQLVCPSVVYTFVIGLSKMYRPSTLSTSHSIFLHFVTVWQSVTALTSGSVVVTDDAASWVPVGSYNRDLSSCLGRWPNQKPWRTRCLPHRLTACR